MADIGLGVILTLITFAFVCEYMDSTLGMGYGTTLTPVLLLMGYRPIQIVPAVLLSELISGILAAFFHHREGNVNFKPESNEIFQIQNILEPLGYMQSFRKTLPQHLKVALLLTVCSIGGTVAAVSVAVSIPKFWLKLYIGCLVLSMGVIILILFKRQFGFSWKKVAFLGLIASFNKGMSGGGYGPVVTGGQILSGVEGKSAVGITSLAEGLTCLVGVIAYILLSNSTIDWHLAPLIVIGAVLSVPLSAKSVKFLGTKRLKLAIGILTIILGSLTIIKTVM